MSPKSAQRFWDNDMYKIKNLKRVAQIRSDATRFRVCPRSFSETRLPLFAALTFGSGPWPDYASQSASFALRTSFNRLMKPSA
ncbi:MAG: hypothetical protein E5W92_03100 [Mesorhizobium sp.]|nr:MAG: hypothetical protein E5W92_03100 [Mesorhizobium sp.]